MEHSDRIRAATENEGIEMNESLDELSEFSNRYQSDLEPEQSDFDEDQDCYRRGAHSNVKVSANPTSIALNKMDRQTDQLFFEFFGMYTKESLKA